MFTKNQVPTAHFEVQITEDPNGRIHMWVTGPKELKKVFKGPINFSRRTGRSGNKAWSKMHALIETS